MKGFKRLGPIFRIGGISLMLLGVLCVALIGIIPRSSRAAQESFPTQYFAPYVDVALSGDPFKDVINNAGSKAGTKFYTLAFVNALQAGQCAPAWKGQTASDLTYMQQEITTLRAAGGDVIVSFGGPDAADPAATSPDLALTCTSATTLQSAYQSVIDSYHLSHIDFHLAGMSATASAAFGRLNQAVAALKSGVAGSPLSVSYSLPITPADGLGAAGVAILQDAIAKNVTLAYVNGIARDYAAPTDPAHMGQNAIDAANKLFAQLKGLYPQKADSDVWAMIGITPMIGVNDPMAGSLREVFSLDDAKALEQFAAQSKLHALSLWELHRDQAPTGGFLFPIADVTTTAPNLDSGIQQTPYQFSTIFNAFTGTTSGGTGGTGQGNGSTSTCGTVTAGNLLPWAGTLSAGDSTTNSWKTAWSVTSKNSFNLSSNLSLSDDPQAKFGKVFKVLYPAQLSASSSGAGFETRPDLKLPTDKRDDLFLHYCSLFPTGFDFVRGGKLPGISAGTGPFSGGDAPQSDAQGFSARMMWRTGTLSQKVPPYGVVYTYVQPGMQDSFAHPQGYKTHIPTDSYGIDVGPTDQSSWPVKADNTWHAVQEEVKLNTPGKSDGAIRIWLDEAAQDKPVLDAEGLTFRNTAALDMSQAGIDFQTFFGGHDATWAPSKDQTAYFTNFALSDQYISTGTPVCVQGDPGCNPQQSTCPAGQFQQTSLSVSSLSIDIAPADRNFCDGQKETFTLSVKGDTSSAVSDANGQITVTALIPGGLDGLASQTDASSWQVTFSTTSGQSLMVATYIGAASTSLPPITWSGTFNSTDTKVTIFAWLILSGSGQASTYAASIANLTVQPPVA